MRVRKRSGMTHEREQSTDLREHWTFAGIPKILNSKAVRFLELYKFSQEIRSDENVVSPPAVSTPH